MFGQPAIPRASSEFFGDSLTYPDVITTSPLNSPALCPLTQLTIADSFESVSEAFQSGSSSGSYNSPSSLTSCCTTTTTQKQSFMQRSVSSHSLQIQKNGFHCHLTSSLNDYIDSASGPVRRVFSNEDLDQGISKGQRNWRSESPLSSESNAIIEGMSRAWPYSPEEKKERIERYRSKRNLRNFNKKIKYACRKTLADSRPRIRGRFARNDEIEKNPNHHQVLEWNHISAEEDEENWITFIDSFPPNLINP